MTSLNVSGNFKVIKHEWVQIQIPGGSTATRLYFPELPNLRDVHLMNLESTNATILPFSVDNSAVITQNLFFNTFLTLVDYTGKEFVHQIPLIHLLYVTGATHYEQLIKQMSGQIVNWTKSYIEFSSNANIPATLTVCPFSIYYKERSAIEKKERRANFIRKS